MFHSFFERKNDKVLRFNIAHFPNFEIIASLQLDTSQFQYLISAWGDY